MSGSGLQLTDEDDKQIIDNIFKKKILLVYSNAYCTLD